jgi:hypothetical protein
MSYKSSSVFMSIDLDESEEAVCAGPADLYTIHCINLSTAVVYLKLYDGAPTVGTTVPKMVLAIPTAGSSDGAGFTISFHGVRFSTSIYAAATTGVAHTDTTGPAANLVVVNIEYV